MDNKEKNNKNIIGIIILAAIVVITILFFLLQGSTTTTGNFPENTSDKSLTCAGENIAYPIFTYDNATKKTAEISVLFSKDKFKSIVIAYNLYYTDVNSISASEAHNHAAMGQSFADDGLEADALSATYSKFDDRMQMRLYATDNQLTDKTTKYFMIDSREPLVSLGDFQNIYQKNGFVCKIQ